MENILIFGAGTAAKKFFHQVRFNPEKAAIIGFLDNEKIKQGQRLEGYYIYNPMDGIQLPFNWIIVLGSHAVTMRLQLLEMGISADKILFKYDLYRHQELFLEREITILCKPSYLNKEINEISNKMIALFTHNFTYNGGTIALLRMAQILHKHRFHVIVFSAEDGVSREEFELNNITVVIDPNLVYKTLEDYMYLSRFSLIVINTIQLASLLKKHNIPVPVVWWLHDPEETYQTSGFRLQKMNTVGLDIYAAGDIGWEPFAVSCPDVPKQILMYGVPDMCVNYACNFKARNKLVFAMIGTFNRIKAQDIFFDAIELLPKDKMRVCEFLMIGNNETSMGKLIKNRADKYDCVRITGILNREQIKKAFQEISVLVTPSRTDIMPIVNGEAMMNNIPCIVGENVGTAALLQHEMNGLIFKQADAEDLARKIEWMIDHRNRIPQMGAEARKVYEKYYSMERFEKRVMKMLAKHGIFSQKKLREEQDV